MVGRIFMFFAICTFYVVLAALFQNAPEGPSNKMVVVMAP